MCVLKVIELCVCVCGGEGGVGEKGGRKMQKADPVLIVLLS